MLLDLLRLHACLTNECVLTRLLCFSIISCVGVDTAKEVKRALPAYLIKIGVAPTSEV